MLSTQLYSISISSSKAGLLVGRQPPAGVASGSFPGVVRARPRWERKARGGQMRRRCATRAEAAQQVDTGTSAEVASSVKALVTVQLSIGGLLTNVGMSRGLDDISDMLGKTLLLELLSSDLNPKSGLEKEALRAYAHKISEDGNKATYEADFVVPTEFGEVGAVVVENEHHKEMHLIAIHLSGLPFGDVHITCNSWVHSKFDNPENRIFFTNKSYLPSETPAGLKKQRARELEIVRGNGEGERHSFERIYDYDTYNDLGDPDLKRPVFGDEEHPYPRRCRTGRPRCRTDPASETRSSSVYVPRDEQFSGVKEMTFSATAFYNVLHAVLPSLEMAMIDPDLGFPHFTAIEALFDEGIKLPGVDKRLSLRDILPRLVKAVADTEEGILRFEPPALLNRDRFGWIRDEEMARQTLAGLNPCSIKLVTEWPLKSKLDPNIYGPPESAITTEVVEKQIKGFSSIDAAIKQNKLFIIDYHDAFLPYVNKVREVKGTVLYGSRTLFYLMPNDTLRPVAIELTRPPHNGKPRWNEVYTPIGDSTACWLWRFAKAHFLAHDAGYHQLISHWLRTHCCVEPYIIATNRQLSAMHPIYRLLHPHFRYTMEINALAREALINAGGIIESSFTPGKYSIEVSSAIYGQQWQFDLQALPADLIGRGMAVADPSAPHGLRLTIQDYPFANDGLLIWDCIKEWVTDYVKHYYGSSEAVRSDQELQSWWTEIRTKGHADKKDEPWWPQLETVDDLVGILNNIIWVASGHHAAVNFGQYAYGGYFPNRPTVARTKMPTEDPSDHEWNLFMDKPEVELLKCFPSQIQATKIMAILDVLSSHSPDEEYLGEKPEPSWADNSAINAAFERFSGRLKEIDGIVDQRNVDSQLRNRCGAGVVPYELLKPYSTPGATGMGVPNSISI